MINSKGYKNMSKQLDVPVTTVAHIIQMSKEIKGEFKGQGTSVTVWAKVDFIGDDQGGHRSATKSKF